MYERINALQSALAKNPAQFAQQIGFNYKSYNRIKNGLRAPSLELVTSILKTFRQVDPYWLLLGEGEMFKKEKGPINVDASETTITDNSAPVTVGHNSTISTTDMSVAIATLEKTIERQQQIINKLMERL